MNTAMRLTQLAAGRNNGAVNMAVAANANIGSRRLGANMTFAAPSPSGR